VRASDFISLRNSTLEFALPALRAGPTVRLPGPLDMPHTFTCSGDVARALIVLGRDEWAWGRARHVPSPAPVTMRELVRRTARVGGFAEPRVRRIPGPVMYASGWFNKVREGDARDELPVRPP
jgi:nucleoside-diphosphate-sugar epimerase